MSVKNIGELIKQLEKLAHEYGHDTRIAEHHSAVEGNRTVYWESPGRVTVEYDEMNDMVVIE